MDDGQSTDGHTEGDIVVDDFRFANGQTLPDLRLHYTTLGAPTHDATGAIDNAILLLHGTTGSGAQFLAPSFAGALCGPGQPLDATRWYLIAPDAIGHGGSSKPSDGLRARFPAYGYGDMVRAQHQLVTERLGVARLRLVLGTSMGGMHTWLWGQRYPDAMDGLVPIACEPAPVQGRNLLWRHIIARAIRDDPAWDDGDYAAQPPSFAAVWPLFRLLTDSLRGLQGAIPTPDAADADVERVARQAREREDANDQLYGLEASRDYNPTADLGRIEAPLLAINFVDDALNPSELGVLDRAITRVPRGRHIVITEREGARGHATLNHAAVYRAHLARFLSSLPMRGRPREEWAVSPSQTEEGR